MRVVAVDPGYGRCGVAVLEKESAAVRVLYSDCIETSGDLPFSERLMNVSREIENVISEFKASALAMEKLFFNTNQKTALQVAEIRGAVIEKAARAGLAFFEYTPGQVKAAVTGYGRADKKAIASMIHALTKMKKVKAHDDEYDAIAVGITHLAHFH